MSDILQRIAMALKQQTPQGYDAQSAPSALSPLYDALAPAPNTEYGTILPIARDTVTGEKRAALPNIFREGLGGMLDLMSGVDTGQVTPRAAETLALGGLGGGMVAAPKGVFASGGAPIRAYHGSPHSFDRFDASKIGAGEGAQAYGHGLYFAENEGVAKSYRDTLAKGYMVGDGQAPMDVNRALEFVHPKYKQSGDMAAGVADAITRMKDQAEFYRRTYGAGPNLYDSAAERLASLDPATLKPAGHMYEVGIHADPARFLDWDKPLSAQSGPVKALDDAYWSQYPKGLPGAPDFLRSAEGAKAAADLGIPGIRYLDQGSRSAFKVRTTYKGEPYSDPVSFPDFASAERWAAEQKAKGFGAEHLPGSSNYVVFPGQEDIIEILRKYMMGVPAPVAAPPSPEQRGSIFEKVY